MGERRQDSPTVPRGNPANGEWPSRWIAEPSGFGEGRREWKAGWVRDEKPPADPRGRTSPNVSGWRELGLVEGDATWRRDHRKRVMALRGLRKAGYVARYRWAREQVGLRQVGRHVLPDVRYADGPAADCQAVDPWKLANELATCGASWYVQARQRNAATPGGSVMCLPLPRFCGRSQVCPVCATMKGRKLARALRAVVAEQSDEIGAVGHLTLTQRAHPGETLADAYARWRRAWDLLTKGRRGRRWAELVAGSYYGIEVTRGDGASSSSLGPWWHVHAHAVVALSADAGDQADIQAELGEMWRAATAAASAHLGESPDGRGFGWDPIAGITQYVIRVLPGAAQRRPDLLAVAVADGWESRPTGQTIDGRRAERFQEPAASAAARLAAGDWSGPWLRFIDTDDQADLGRAVGQTADYACKTAELHPVALAEYVAAAHGRRWHQGSGIWRSVIRDAQRLADAEFLADCVAGVEDPERVDLGVGVSGAGPGESPALDQVLPGAGWIEADVAGAVMLLGKIDPTAATTAAAMSEPAPGGSPAPGRVLSWRIAETPEGDEFCRLAKLASPEAFEEQRRVRIRRPDRSTGELRQVDDVEIQRWLTLPASFVAHRTRAAVGELRRARTRRRESAQTQRGSPAGGGSAPGSSGR